MKAVVLTAYGDVNKLEVTDIPDPEPGPGQIKVRMAGASINPVDWKLLGKLKPGGTIGSVVGEPAGAKERGFVARGLFAHPDGERLAALARAVVDGKLIVPIVKKLPLAQAREAQTLAEHHADGKVLLRG
jgi:NADPH:quinone reductase-like Zn-dependent oxidoreductase